MSELVGGIPIPANPSFELPDNRGHFSVDLVAAHRRIIELEKQFAESTLGEHLEPWIAWLKERTGVELTLAEADWFWEFVITRRAEAQRDFFQTLSSLQLTASTPSP